MQSLPVFWNHSRRARRLSLRVDPTRRGVVITLPQGATRQQGLTFLQTQTEWVLTALAGLPPPAGEGKRLPVDGKDRLVVSCPQARRGVWLEEDRVCVSGAPEHLERRLRDWLKERAARTLPARVRHHAGRHGFTPSTIVLRDVRSRWGSCTRQGRIMLSWRLVFAPPAIQDYVILHELAHLHHFNHGKAFWDLVDQLLPGGPEARKQAEKWLKTHGAALLATL
ncbi:M48 family peptidase [Oecophyllibacter saccharovorans]|uniref:M48 family metallopeptidase n=1 Tax=Oecophyllibacter saccharovorans TaxID=2558360 RepID=UPI001143C04C|nr:SprT family zinc-dependent metalloprotease [Oecophyllibacter saccharovorans]QDH15393.1 M48 family peptidase [Oecophyllibacter saccharovorans]